jgi:hypothetical protein
MLLVSTKEASVSIRFDLTGFADEFGQRHDFYESLLRFLG